ncbi:flagellar basal-body MS-ring/collar protein FliF [Polaromonas sp. A23]|uniref:flagellar basal-body MS-ring/collar protein FliF n=1 Tax=Polaromonas sp. A23 TaxID=1944133 RepID=UPI0009CE7382|nr:flagellar basal-body MS-ring/collar protein FliF [Polaromonas sp. A23]OOG44442.1 flagellar M-ring protein FliF [Polaromonas sp. A23]
MFQQLKLRWESSTTRSKTFLLGGVVAIFLLFCSLTYWAIRDDYQVLFSNMEPQDAAQMVAELDKQKIPYRLANDATTILVDKDVVHKTRLKLMGKGMTLKGNVGFELFNNTDYGTTEFAQKVNFQRALQGELSRTISAMDEIKSARIHLVLPESGLLRRQGSKAKASVSLLMKGDAQLSAEQIAGIQRLVAAAVPEMDSGAVTILDQRGVALTPLNGTDSAAASTSGKLEVKKEIESYLTRKVVGLLDKALGPGKALVSIDVTLNYDQIKITTEDVFPEGGGVILRRKQSQQSQQSQQGSSLRLGNVTDPKNHSTDRPIPDRSSPSSSMVDVEYQNSRRVEQIVGDPGNVKRISVGLLLPGGVSKGQVVQIKEVVEMAVGLNSSRGDAIAVHSVDQIMSAPSVAVERTDNAPMVDKNVPKKVMHPDAGYTVIWLLALFMVCLLIAGGVIATSRLRKSKKKGSLSPTERERALQKIMEWADSELSEIRTVDSR